MSNDLIQEVEDSLRQERTAQLWKEYGPYLVAGIILVPLFAPESRHYHEYPDEYQPW